jgi:rhodanese-related sulfurtransferase
MPMSNNDAHDLKLRLEWGHPALTIIDVRDRHTYNQGHISGAIPIP